MSSRTLNGREALARLDMAIADLRRAVGDAMSAADTIAERRASVRGHQVEAYGLLADIRLDIAVRSDPSELDDLHDRAAALLAEHETYVAREAGALAEASDRIAALEAKRADLLAKHDKAIAAFEGKVAKVEAALAEDDAYVAIAEAAEKAESVVARAQQKLDLARQDREEKGAPYEGDPLFMYLWKRRFRTPDYKSGSLIRFLDGWVARLCKYDQAYLNYDRLTELPDRLAEHVTRVEAQEVAAESALDAAEVKALKDAGAETLQKKAEAILIAVAEVDAEIEAAEVDHQEIARRHEEALRLESGPAADARRLLEEGLKQASFPDLRVLAAETVDLDDDRLVDALVKLRAEEMSLDLEADRAASLPARHREDLGAVEALRRKFKSARFDSAYARFQRAHVDQAITDIVRGAAGVDGAFRMLRRSMRRAEPTPGRGFGGRRRSNTLGLPAILGDIAWEIAKEAGREGMRGGSPWGGRSPRRRSRRINFPSGGGGKRRSGGFKTGGGF